MAKQITLVELDLLKKAMGLTFSIHDGEALSALRKANVILRKHELTWAEVLGRTVTHGITPVDEEVEGASGGELSIHEQTKRAFNELRGTVSGSFAIFIESIEQQFIRTGYLSPEQRRPLFKAVRNNRERRRRDE